MRRGNNGKQKREVERKESREKKERIDKEIPKKRRNMSARNKGMHQ